MNNSKENILKRIAAAGMPEYAYPDFGYEPQHFDDPAAMFAQRLRAAGGEAVWLDGATTLDEVVRRCYPDAKSVASALPEVTLATVNPDRHMAHGVLPAPGAGGQRSTTVTDIGPWAPNTSACSMSAVFEGPDMKHP